MSWLLRAIAVISLVWAAVLFGGSPYLLDVDARTPLVIALGNGLAASSLVFAFLFWRAAAEKTANHTVIYGAILLLLLKTAADLYELLVLLEGVAALVVLADLVLSVGLAVGVIESLPRAFRGEHK